MKSQTISGTPRMTSMKATLILLMMKRFDCRPSARRMPSGSDRTMPVTPMMTASMKPPKSLERHVGQAEGQRRR